MRRRALAGVVVALVSTILLARPALADVADTASGCRPDAIKPLARATRAALVPFRTSPFPYDGKIPTDGRSFLDYEKDGKRGHTSPRGNLHLEEEAYNDRRSLLYLPGGFDLSRPEHALIVVFFHGNNARLRRDVEIRQRVPLQLARSGLNAALVVPQFAVDIPDSSAGWFWQPSVFKQYLAEAAEHLAALRGDPCTKPIFDRLGVVLVAYSGGYNPAAYALAVGDADSRIRGVILLDALYGETDKFDKWIGASAGKGGTGFFFSAYSDSSRVENLALQQSLAYQGIAIETPPHRLRLNSGSVTFLFAGAAIDHNDFVTSAWVRDPLKAVLSTIEGFRITPQLATTLRTGIPRAAGALRRQHGGQPTSKSHPP
jgi:hypothetical protein